MSRRIVLASICLFSVLVCQAEAQPASGSAPGAPVQLRCEYLANPLGIDETTPRLSWIMVDGRRGAAQTAYRILVADDPAKLANDAGNLWDTDRVESAESIQIAYAGRPLTSRLQVWWKVRVWDRHGQPSPWSAPATWTMGLLQPADWQAKWIGEAAPASQQHWRPARNGYHSAFADHPNVEKWVQIDLGEVTRIDAVRLYPARPFDWRPDDPNFLYPVRLKVLVSTTKEFTNPTTVVERTASDLPNPEGTPQTYSFNPVEARCIRLVATQLRRRDANAYGLALAEMQVLAGERNVAVGKTVTAADSIEQGAWAARFLVDDDLKSHDDEGMEPLPPPMLRKTFALKDSGTVARAFVYVTALGLYELNLNGRRVGDHQLAPEWTDYRRRVQYQTYDVTDLLRAGDNALGVQLADGWYAGAIGMTGVVPDGPPRAIYGRHPRLLLQLEIHHQSGRVERIISDETWRLTTEGPLRMADLMKGETYDARRALPGWTEPGFDDSAWKTAAAFDPPPAQLVAQPNEPIRKTREIKTVKITERQPGVYVIDLGQNFAGWCRLQARGTPGETITLRHAEILNPDGTLHVDNLGSADATDRYIPRGDGVETYAPRFTYHGFRYVEITGLKEPPNLTTLTGCVVHTDAPEVGEFECSNPMFNRLWQNILWTQRANMYSIPTDCPQRAERLGWAGDIRVFAQTGCFNLDMAAFFTKWLVDFRDAQAEDGRYPDFAPHPYDPNVRFSGVPAWGDAGVFVPWCQYLNYGDRRLLDQHFESARRWVDWIQKNNPDLLWKNKRHNDYADWLNGDTIKAEGWLTTGAAMPRDAFATAFFARSTQIVADMAKVLSRDSDAQHYAALAADIRKAFNQAYVQPDGRMTGDTQAGYALALDFDLLPEELHTAAAKHMVECFKRYNGQISTGIQSTNALMQSLNRYGYLDEAYRLVNNRKMPSWGYAIEHGATTIWERWDGYVEGRGIRIGMNSFSHYAIGSVGEWMYRTILGINPDPAAPAYRHFVIRPRPGGDLTSATGAYHSIRGRITCAWRLENGRLALNVTVPPNTTATTYLPTRNAQSVRESGAPLADAEGVTNVRAEEAHVMCELAAGEYRFEMDAKSGS